MAGEQFPEPPKSVSDLVREQLDKDADEVRALANVFRLIEKEQPELLDTDTVKKWRDDVMARIGDFAAFRAEFEAHELDEQGTFTPETIISQGDLTDPESMQ